MDNPTTRDASYWWIMACGVDKFFCGARTKGVKTSWKAKRIGTRTNRDRIEINARILREQTENKVANMPMVQGLTFLPGSRQNAEGCRSNNV